MLNRWSPRCRNIWWPRTLPPRWRKDSASRWPTNWREKSWVCYVVSSLVIFLPHPKAFVQLTHFAKKKCGRAVPSPHRKENKFKEQIWVKWLEKQRLMRVFGSDFRHVFNCPPHGERRPDRVPDATPDSQEASWHHPRHSPGQVREAPLRHDFLRSQRSGQVHEPGQDLLLAGGKQVPRSSRRMWYIQVNRDFKNTR